MKLKHTPGPWTAFNDAGPQMQSYSQPSGVRGNGDHRLKLVCGCFGDIGGAEVAAANARLIAAAPEMLAALQALSNMYGSTWDRVDGALVMMATGVARFEHAHEMAMQAIAKATGAA